MEMNDLVAEITGTSITNGWDAVLAINAAQVNALFFQQYLNAGPTDFARHVHALIPDGGDYWVLDVTLGPPLVSFSAELNQQQLGMQMFLLSGTLAKFDAGKQVITSVLQVQPNESWLSGTVSLTKLVGEANQVGQVVMELGRGSFQIQIKGLDPNPALKTNLGEAIKDYFAANRVQYPLGTIVQSGVQACLQPTDFEFVTQPAPGGGGDGAVLLLIKTNGSGGTVGPITPYPIPDRYTSALIVSNQVLFNQLLPPFLTQEFKIGTQFAGQQSNGLWQAVGSGGSIDVGLIQTDSGDSSDSDGEDQDVTVSIDNFTVSGAGAYLSANWNQSWEQYWTYPVDIGSRYAQTETTKVTLTVSYAYASQASVEPVADIVSFSGTGTVSVVSSGGPDWFQQEILGLPEVSAQFTDAVQGLFQEALEAFSLPDVNTFALANLLFPSGHVLSLQQAAVPGDLLLVGEVNSKLVVVPSCVQLKPGASKQFSAKLYGNSLDITPSSGQVALGATQQFEAKFSGQPVPVSWQLIGERDTLGTIDENGLYTAPLYIPLQQEWSLWSRLKAVSKDGNLTASLALSPDNPYGASLVLFSEESATAGDMVSLDADVIWIINPPDQGLINNSNGFYTAPSSISQAEVVVVTATSKFDTTKAASAEVLVYQPPAATGIIISPAALTLTAGQSFDLLVTDASGKPVEASVTLNPNLGSLAKGENTGQWTYTAPSLELGSTEVTVTAVSTVNPSQTGTSVITLVSSTPVSITADTQHIVYCGQDGHIYELWLDITTDNAISVGPAGKVPLTASVPDESYGPDSFEWMLSASTGDAGSIGPDPNDSSRATYTAPASVSAPTKVTVMAYDTSETGAGVTSIYLAPNGREGSWKWNDLTKMASAPPSAGKPMLFVWQGIPQVVYRDQAGQIYELSWTGTAWTCSNLTEQSNASSPAADDPLGYAWENDPNGSSQHVVYRGQDGNLYELYFQEGSGWSVTNVTENIDSGQLPGGNPSATVWDADLEGPTQHLFFRGKDNHIYEFYSFGTGLPWQRQDVTEVTHDQATSESDPTAFVWEMDNSLHVGYRDNSNSIHDLYRLNNGWRPATDASWMANKTLPPEVLGVGNPAGLAYNSPASDLPPTMHYFYRRADGHIGELWSTQEGSWWVNDLSTQVSNPLSRFVPPAGDPRAYVRYADPIHRYSQHVVYCGEDGHLYVLSNGSDRGGWTIKDLTEETNAPLAAGD